jgi:hypothetical protein
MTMFPCPHCSKGPFDTAIDLQLHQKEFHSADKAIVAMDVTNAGAITASHQPSIAPGGPTEDPASEPAPSTLRGKLPDDFPHRAELEGADTPLTTYAQVRNAIKKDPQGWFTDIKGIGDKSAPKIAEAVGASAEGDEEE